MDHLHPLTFRDIMATDLFYHDPEQEAACADLCRLLKVTYLPCLELVDHFVTYEDNGTFSPPALIQEEMIVDAGMFIFDPRVLKKFEKNAHNILFVYQYGRMLGVVHISDYNKRDVLMNYYAYILDFEQRLRNLLMLHGRTNQDMLDFFKRKGQEDAYFLRKLNSYDERDLREMEMLSSFQLFSLADVLNLLQDHNILPLKTRDIHSLRRLRNSIMHGQDTVSRVDRLFSLPSLRKHFKEVRVFIQTYGKLRKALNEALIQNKRHRNRVRLETMKDFDPPMLNGSQLMWEVLKQG